MRNIFVSFAWRVMTCLPAQVIEAFKPDSCTTALDDGIRMGVMRVLLRRIKPEIRVRKTVNTCRLNRGGINPGNMELPVSRFTAMLMPPRCDRLPSP